MAFDDVCCILAESRAFGLGTYNSEIDLIFLVILDIEGKTRILANPRMIYLSPLVFTGFHFHMYFLMPMFLLHFHLYLLFRALMMLVMFGMLMVLVFTLVEGLGLGMFSILVLLVYGSLEVAGRVFVFVVDFLFIVV